MNLHQYLWNLVQRGIETVSFGAIKVRIEDDKEESLLEGIREAKEMGLRVFDRFNNEY